MYELYLLELLPRYPDDDLEGLSYEFDPNQHQPPSPHLEPELLPPKNPPPLPPPRKPPPPLLAAVRWRQEMRAVRERAGLRFIVL